MKKIANIRTDYQLSQLNKNIELRNIIAKKYDEHFSVLPIKTQKKIKGFKNAYHLYVIQTENRDQLYNHLKKKNIFSQVHYIPLYNQPYYKKIGWKKTDFPNSEYYYSKCLSIPIYPTLNSDEQNYVIKTICNFLK